MKFLKMFILSSVILTSLISYAGPENTPKSMAEAFLQRLKDNQISEAYANLFTDSPLIKAQPQAASMLELQTKNGIKRYGKILGYELVSEKKFGSSIIKFVYVLKMELHPTSWEFFFYKTKSKWILSQIVFDDNFTILKKIK